jgi:hypothetical protein
MHKRLRDGRRCNQSLDMPLKAEFISSLFQEIKAYQIEARCIASADRSK